jgi:hypothetical protein
MAKQGDRMDLLLKVAMQIHNPAVLDAYGSANSTDPTASAALRNALIIRPDDGFLEAILKMNTFYLAAGRVNAIAPVPTLWAVKAERMRAQLAIVLRPVKRVKLGHQRYQPNSELHIPHYDPANKRPEIPTYTIGPYTAKYTLKDGSHILINAASDDEAMKVIKAMAQYVLPAQQPPGSIEDNTTHTRRKGKKLKLDGVPMKPFRAAFYAGGQNSDTPAWTVNL